MKLTPELVDAFAALVNGDTEKAADINAYGTVSMVDGKTYVKMDGSDLLVPASTTVKVSDNERVRILMQNHEVTIVGNLSDPSGSSSGGTIDTNAFVKNVGNTHFSIMHADHAYIHDHIDTTIPELPVVSNYAHILAQSNAGGVVGAMSFGMDLTSDVYVYLSGSWHKVSDGGNATSIGNFTESALSCLSNDNILANPDISINQRGQSVYTTPRTYTADMWVMSLNGAKNTCSYNIDTHVLTCGVKNTNGFYANLQQYIENPMRFAGKTMTLSCMMSDLEMPALIQVWRTEGATTTSIASSGYNTNVHKILTFTMPADLTIESKVRVLLQTRGSAKMHWAKLELGSVATPFVPPNPATELAKCQRYFIKLSQWSAYRAIHSNVNYMEFAVPIPTSMRAIPTIVNGDNFAVYKFPHPVTAEEGLTYSISAMSANELRLRASKEAHGLSDACLHVIVADGVFLSAEL